ncbi:MAG: hypothetical protein JETT_2805 [Candidatus Jettenia ecosi]|uniref:Exo-alpha-sialidase n=1 Tax=Candidatus Jettenia ecosi TaxID=2494326 RepID=A0A533Q8D4_9BACT|nr:MAG: hypothetical protein JETT_2805 [Candidatus Jettenia ecosi]
MLRKRKPILIMGVACIVGLLGVRPLEAQPAPKNTLARLEMLSERGKFLKQRLGKNVSYLSSGYQMIIDFEERWDSIKPMLERAVEQGGFPEEGDEVKEIEKALTPPAPFTRNNPCAKSDSLSLFGGFTQHNPSIGWWGNNAVCGFSDSGSYAATILPIFDESLPPSPSPSGSFSRLGWSRSSNAGAAFMDKGILLAVDTSGTATNGNVYVIWHDGRNLSRHEPLSLDFRYRFADILFSKSTDGGSTWSAPVRVNNDPITKKADQFIPAIAVDKTGKIGVLFYDRKYNLRNFLIDVTVATSGNAGTTWMNRKVTKRSFTSGLKEEFVFSFYFSIGEYIAIAQDASKANNGFIGAWGESSLGDNNIGVAKLK